MKNLNRKSLRHMIMAILNEHRIAPDIPALSSRELGNLNSIIDAGDSESIEMARSLIDVDEFGVDADRYIDDYREYSGVGDIEKMGNQATSLPPDDADVMDSEMEDWATLHAMKMNPDNEDEYYDMLMNRYYTSKNNGLNSNTFLKEENTMKNLNRRALRRMIAESLNEMMLLSGGDVRQELEEELHRVVDEMYGLQYDLYVDIGGSQDASGMMVTVSEMRSSAQSPYIASRRFEVLLPQPGPNDGDPRNFQGHILVDDMSFPDCRSAAEYIAREIPEFDFNVDYR